MGHPVLRISAHQRACSPERGLDRDQYCSGAAMGGAKNRRARCRQAQGRAAGSSARVKRRQTSWGSACAVQGACWDEGEGKGGRLCALACRESARARRRARLPGRHAGCERTRSCLRRKQGVGRRLVEMLLARRDGSSVYCLTPQYRTAFYEACGFRTLPPWQLPPCAPRRLRCSSLLPVSSAL